jgi:two-component system, chemotaxis family, protein-glutamate methylesterase/glutaminase
LKQVKVLIADDSVVYRSQIRAALTSLSWIEIVGVASNGRLALDRLRQSAVDLLILDLEMPEVDGIQVLKEICANKISCKTLVFSSASKRGADITLEALRLGASDFVTKPGHDSCIPVVQGESDPSKRIREILEPKIRAFFPQHDLVASSQPVTHVNQKYPSVLWDIFKPKVVVIGSSTGGPTVLERIFAALAAPFDCPILITQHMPPIFTASLAERLQKLSGVPTTEGAHGMILEPNHVYVAPGDFHMRLKASNGQTRIELDQGPLIHSIRPAVDHLFTSAASIYGEHCLGIVLTGMGADGKHGAEQIKQQKGAVLIQSEESCVVFGMPGAVKSIGAFDKIMSPGEIANVLQSMVMSNGLQKKVG